MLIRIGVINAAKNAKRQIERRRRILPELRSEATGKSKESAVENKAFRCDGLLNKFKRKAVKDLCTFYGFEIFCRNSRIEKHIGRSSYVCNLLKL